MESVDFDCCKIPNAVEARTLQRGCDRRAFSRRKIKEGELILRNAPTAHTLISEQREKRCARCLATQRRTEDQSKQSLLRCGRCKKIWYCSRECQKQDFWLHKFECKQCAVLFPSEQPDNVISSILEGLTSPESNNIGCTYDYARLLVRNFVAMRVPRKSNICESRCLGDRDIVYCGSKHFDNLFLGRSLSSKERLDVQRASQALWNQRKVINQKAPNGSSIIESLSELEEQLEADLRRIVNNSVGVSDSLVLNLMLHVLATACFPLGALFNHSCSPNCIVRFDIGWWHEPPVMEVVAARDIPKGEELTFTYVDLLFPRQTRRKNLRNFFGFDCFCEKCTAPADDSRFQIWLPHNHGSLSPIQLSRWVIENYNPSNSMFKPCDTSSLSFLDHEIIMKSPALDSPSYQASVEKANVRQQAAALLTRFGNIEEAVATLKEAVQLIESGLAKVSSATGNPPLSIDLYMARIPLLLCMTNKLPPELCGQEAMIEAEHIVAFLCLVLKHFPNYPMVGIMLNLLGSHYNKLGETEKALATYTWARRILRLNQGDKGDRVLFLDKKLEEIRGMKRGIGSGDSSI